MNKQTFEKAFKLKREIDHLTEHLELVTKLPDRVTHAQKMKPEFEPFLVLELPGITNGGYKMWPDLFDINYVHSLYVKAVKNKIAELQAQFDAL